MFTIELIVPETLTGLVAGSFRVGAEVDSSGLHIRRQLAETTSIKDAIEAIGIPHCEIGAVLRPAPTGPDRPVPLDSLIREADILAIQATGPRALADPRFLCDRHLGKLARLLRTLGFDTLWNNSWSEPEMARRGVNEQRVVLSGSRSLLKRKDLILAQLIRSSEPDAQVGEVLLRWLVADQAQLFGRCSLCNGTLRSVAKTEVAERIPPRTALWLDEYYLCRGCDQLFWNGTHVSALTARLQRILVRCGRNDGTD